MLQPCRTWRTKRLRLIWSIMLMREGAVQRYPKIFSHKSLDLEEMESICTRRVNVPLCRVVPLLQRIANASMGSSEDSVAFSFKLRRIKLHCHQLIHVPHHEHVTVELNNPLVLSKPERS